MRLLSLLILDAYENLKYIKPDLDLRSSEIVDNYTQQTINLILAGVIHEK